MALVSKVKMEINMPLIVMRVRGVHRIVPLHEQIGTIMMMHKAAIAMRSKASKTSATLFKSLNWLKS